MTNQTSLVNDLLSKTIGIANTKIPQVSALWLKAENVFRQYRKVDISVSVCNLYCYCHPNGQSCRPKVPCTYFQRN